jgi:hypothetical protein
VLVHALESGDRDDAWEEGLFLGFLANYCLIGYWRYWEQKNEDERSRNTRNSTTGNSSSR